LYRIAERNRHHKKQGFVDHFFSSLRHIEKERGRDTYTRTYSESVIGSIQGKGGCNFGLMVAMRVSMPVEQQQQQPPLLSRYHHVLHSCSLSLSLSLSVQALHLSTYFLFFFLSFLALVAPCVCRRGALPVVVTGTIFFFN
jgi:hypothetical protein